MADLESTLNDLRNLGTVAAPEAIAAVQALSDQIALLDQTAAGYSATLGATRRSLSELVKTEDQRRTLGAQAVENIERQIQLLGELKAKIFELNSAYDTQKERIRGLMGINSAWKTSTTGVMAKIMAEGKGVGAAFASITSEMKGAVSGAEYLTSTFMKFQELGGGALAAVTKGSYDLMRGVDDASVALARTTGASGRFTAMIPDMESRLYKLGVTAEMSSQAVNALYSGMSGFTQMSDRSRRVVADSTAVLQKMGISSEVSARNLDILNRSMGMSGPMAADMNQQLFAAAQNIGISTSKMLGDFGSIGPQLIKFGQEATRVYINLQSVAKNTGVEINRLLSITQQFDKFDTAAESVGRLNAILGGPYLNTIQMVMSTDPTQRLQMMTRAVKDAGMNFDSMSYYMRQATASAMGLQDVNELAMLMRGRIDLLGSSTMQSSQDIERMMEQTQRFNSVADMMSQTLRIIAIELGPLVEKIRDLAFAAQENRGIIIGLTGALAGLKIANMAATSLAMASAAMTAMGSAATTAMGPLMMLAGPAVLGALAFTILHKRNSPTLLEGTQMFGSALMNVGTASSMASKSLGSMTSPLDAAHTKIIKFNSALSGVSAEQEGLMATARAVGQIGATIDSVPERKTVKFTTLMDKVNQSGRIANASSGVVQSTAAAMYQPPPPPVQVRQPIKVALEMDSRSIGSQIVDVVLT